MGVPVRLADDGTDAGQLARDCERAGLMIAPGDEWFPAEPAGPYVRLNYSGPDPSAHGEAARVLGAALESQRQERRTAAPGS